MGIVVNSIGIILIVLIIWWFWLKKAKAEKVATDVIKIMVKDGVYTPSRIEVAQKDKITLEFYREDKSACSEYVIFEGIDKQAKLPIDQPFQLELENLLPGKYPFACQMKMYQGELVVVA